MSNKRKNQGDRLGAYRAKRAVERTPEPAGAVDDRGGRLFVVHKHAARQLHFDLRLEMGGVLESWAVPKGPSKNPKDKRLAVKVEDHPLEYGDFESVIPEGNYGAGPMIVWDRGVWVPLTDVAEGFEKGKLLFELRGYKLRGVWTLVKIKKSEKEWLLIKERDHLVSDDGDDYPQGSVLSGLTVEELGEGKRPADSMRDVSRAAEHRTVRLQDVEPMLAEKRERPFTKSGWIFEIKYDGYRLLAALESGEPRLLTRNKHDATLAFPEIVSALRHLPFDNLVLDGEVVVHDETGKPSFQRLQKRARHTRSLDIRRAAAQHPATFYAFDLLAFEDRDVRGMSLLERKDLLRQALPAVGPMRFSDHIETQGEAFYEEVVKLGLEGIVAKKASSTYRAGRSQNWVKVRADRTDDFIVVGYTKPEGARSGFGALHLAAYRDEQLVYVGRVGSGFSATQLEEVREELDRTTLDDPPCSRSPDGKAHVWVQPELVCEVRYKEWTEDTLLRQPVFVRFRDDKPPDECLLPSAGESGAREKGRDDMGDDVFPLSRIQAPELQFTNEDKLFWPDEGYTKGDLIGYYRTIAPWILPYLRNRPLVMTRFPDGIHGKSFFQKDAPDFAPDWIRTETVWSEQTERELRYFVCDSEAALLYVVNLASIPLHVWASRIGMLEQPDWCILDLDPKDAPFSRVVEVAKCTRRLCEDIGLPCFVKTSGSSGLHILVPLGRQFTHDQSRTLGELLARVVVAELPDIATVTRIPSQREGKVYVDYLQNGHGKLLVAPFCVRPVSGALVSMPLRWHEVNKKLNIGKYTIANAPQRMKRLKEDPLRQVLDEKPDLVAVLHRLQGRL
jgi:bifunctional non-homologous end joining protein LigD